MSLFFEKVMVRPGLSPTTLSSSFSRGKGYCTRKLSLFEYYVCVRLTRPAWDVPFLWATEPVPFTGSDECKGSRLIWGVWLDQKQGREPLYRDDPLFSSCQFYTVFLPLFVHSSTLQHKLLLKIPHLLDVSHLCS